MNKENGDEPMRKEMVKEKADDQRKGGEQREMNKENREEQRERG